jgi:hypothetical protein
MSHDTNKKIELAFEVNSDFFTHLHDLMQWKGKEPEAIEHFRNALELYAQVIEGISQGKIPALIDVTGLGAEKMSLPPLLATFKHEKEMQYDKRIDLKKGFL